jgi:phosphoglycolate phosphatase
LESILNRSNISHDEAIYIGDEIRDLLAARGANIAFGGVSWGYNTVESLLEYSPREIFTSVAEIAGKLAY